MSNIDEKIPIPTMDEWLPDTFGGQLKRLRRAKKITQRELAAKVGVDFTYISKIENDRIDPPSQAVCRCMAIVLGADPWELIVAAGKLPDELAAWLLELPIRDLHELAGNAEERVALQQPTDLPEGATGIRAFLGPGRADPSGSWWVGGTDAEDDERRSE